MNALIVCAVLFGVGVYGVLVRRDLVAILASVEVMMGAPLLLLVSTGAATGGGASVEAIALLIIVFAAAEAAVGLALVVAVARSAKTTRIDELTEVRG